jgi:hypothetical protein
MVNASTLEDRTRPAVDESGWIPTRLRFLPWLNWSAGIDREASRGVRASDSRLVRR